MVSIDKMFVCGSVWVQHPCKMHAHVTEWAPPHHVSESLTCKNLIVCVCGWTCQAPGWRRGDSRGGLLTRMDGWMWTSLSRSFHSGWADSSAWDAFVISLVWRAPDHSHWWIIRSPPHPPAYECICVRRTVIAGIAPPAGHVGARKTARSINVHLSTRVDIRFYNCVLHWNETSGVFQKQVHENKYGNMVSRCSCPLQMVSLGRRVPSSPRHLLLSPTNCLLSSFLSVAII